MSARRGPTDRQTLDAGSEALCASVEAAMAVHLRNSPDFCTGRISENARLRAAYIEAAAVIHASGLQALARLEAAQVLAAAIDRRTAAIQRRNCTRAQ